MIELKISFYINKHRKVGNSKSIDIKNGEAYGRLLMGFEIIGAQTQDASPKRD